MKSNPVRRQHPLTLSALRRRLLTLFKQPVFLFFTVLGNGCIFAGALILYYFEHEINPMASTFLDCLSWAVGTVTTIGYGGITPMTTIGKIINIFMMIGGSLFLWSYMALFVTALISPELNHVEGEIKDIEGQLRVALEKIDQSKNIN